MERGAHEIFGVNLDGRRAGPSQARPNPLGGSIADFGERGVHMSEVKSTISQTPLLQVRGLSAGYGEMLALRDVSLEVYPAEIVALVGSNGAGKTTLLRALSRVLGSTGSIMMKGQELSGLTSDQVFALGLVQVPEGRQLFDRMTVQDNLMMGAYLRDDKAAVARDLERMYGLFPRMAERRRQLAGSMSGGEQQMCAMARALMAAPVLMMVDEMSLGLAPIVAEQLMDVLASIRSEGVTVLLVEQDIHLALSGADRGYVMETGQIVHTGAAKALIDDPEVQRAYLGL
ncbi:MAG: amino acid/amide transporter ATP-binding protein 2, family [Rhizobacter sp.]|nr:amino acid/amide transporter ATP-binding protein 2, family [Rhizobacter sp.]